MAGMDGNQRLNVDELVVSLERLKQYSESQISFEDFYRIFEDTDLGFLTHNLLKLPKGTSVFRARPTNHRYNAFPDLVSQLSALPKDSVKKLGRANLTKQSIFYAGSSETVALSETVRWHNRDYDEAQKAFPQSNTSYQYVDGKIKGQVPGDANKHFNAILGHRMKHMIVSEWVLNDDITFFPIIDVEKLSPTSYMRGILLNKKPAGIPQGVWDYHQVVNLFFSKEFTRNDLFNEKDYLLSASCAGRLYKYFASPQLKDTLIGGIMYSSVANGYLGFNYTLTEDAQDKIDFVKAKKVLVFNANYNSFRPQTLIPDRYTPEFQPARFVIHQESIGYSLEGEIYWPEQL
jgi:hypothetical protein